MGVGVDHLASTRVGQCPGVQRGVQSCDRVCRQGGFVATVRSEPHFHGVQSLDESLLDRLGRVHSRDMVFRSYDILRKAGFENINIDLMFAIPGQTLDIWNRTLDEALALGTEHLSCYEVIYEEDTPLYEQLKAGQCDVDDDLAADQYEVLYDRVAEVGFGAYEVANFARRRRAGESVDRPEPEPGIPAFACQHNVGYWRGRDSYGLGPSASEWVRGLRSRNWSNTVLYCEQLEKGRRAKEFAEALPPSRGLAKWLPLAFG